MFVETIRIQDGEVQHITYHNARCNKTQQAIYGALDTINLEQYISIPADIHNQIIKCRIVYSSVVQEVTYAPYNIKPIQSLKCIHADNIDYTYKRTERSALTEVYNRREKCDDVLILKNGFITDSYYANVAFLKGDIWYTPSTPLLHGTARARLLDEQKLTLSNIHIDDISTFEKITLFNAMIPFKTIVLDTHMIV